MQHYSLKDFIAYFKDSLIIHPVTGEVVEVKEISATHPNAVILRNKTTGMETHTSLADLDWKHVSTPRLGFRSCPSGRWLVYLARAAGRRARKGVTPEAIHLSYPSFMQMPMDIRNGEVSQQIYSPEFVPMHVAIQKLVNDNVSKGFALSHNWAVCLGIYEIQKFLILYKNIQVAHSVNGTVWEWTSTAAEALFTKELA